MGVLSLENRLLAIDPGSEKSGWVLYREGRVEECGVDPNSEILRLVKAPVFQDLVIEELQSYGKNIGKTVLDTARWIGRFQQAYFEKTGVESHTLSRVQVKARLCGKVSRGDKEVRRALILRFGGTKERAIGTKDQPGPLYGVASHAWAALGLAVVFTDNRRFEFIRGNAK